MYVIAVVWIVAIVLGVILFQRFTKPPTSPTIGVPGQRVAPRRVYPLWLVLVLFILLVVALWVTLRYGSMHVAPARAAAFGSVTSGPPRG